MTISAATFKQCYGFSYCSYVEIDIFLLNYRWYNSKKRINLSKRDLTFFFFIRTSPRTAIFHWSLRLLSGSLGFCLWVHRWLTARTVCPQREPRNTEPSAWHPASTWLRSHHWTPYLSGSVQRLSGKQTHPEQETEERGSELWSQNRWKVWE